MSNLRRKPYRNQKLRDSAEGQDCMMQLPGICNNNPQTTVLAHSNNAEDGKGMGQKADDFTAAFACSACHDEYDGRTRKGHFCADEKDWYFHRAMKRTWRFWIEQGYLQ